MNPYFVEKPDIIIADDHLIFRQGLKAIINYEDLGTVIGEASNGKELIELLVTLKPDLLLMDIAVFQKDDFEAIKKVLEIQPGLNIIALTAFLEEEYCQKMKDVGAKGFILKSGTFTTLENAINQVMMGDNSFFYTSQKEVIRDLNRKASREKVEKKERRDSRFFFLYSQSI